MMLLFAMAAASSAIADAIIQGVALGCSLYCCSRTKKVTKIKLK